MTYETMVATEAAKRTMAESMIANGADDKSIAKALSVRIAWVRNLRKLKG